MKIFKSGPKIPQIIRTNYDTLIARHTHLPLAHSPLSLTNEYKRRSLVYIILNVNETVKLHNILNNNDNNNSIKIHEMKNVWLLHRNIKRTCLVKL